MSPKRSLSPSAWIFILAFGIRLLIFLRFTDSIHFLPTGGDMKFYMEWGSRIAAGEWTDGRAFYGLPGYSFFLGAVFAIFGFSPFLIGLLQVISESLIALLIYRLGCRAAEGPAGQTAGALAALGWIFFQPAQAFSMILMPTTWLVLAFWAMVAWSLRARSAPGQPASLWKPWLGMGLLVGFVAMFVATILFILPLPAAAAFAHFRRRPLALLGAIAFLMVGVFAGSAPCWLHNFFVAREPVFLSAHSGINFWIGNNPAATGYPTMPPGIRPSQSGMLADSMHKAEEAAGRPLTRVEVSRFWSGKADAYIRENPGEWLSLMARKLRNLGNAFQYDDLSVITPMREEGILAPGLRFGIVAALAIPGAFFCVGRYPAARWIAAATLLHLAALLPVFVTERYRLAAVPGLLLLGALGLVRIANELRSRTPGGEIRFAAYLGIGLAGALYVWFPVGQASLQSLEAYNTGLKALEAGQLDKARQKLEAAHAKTPDNAEVNFALGNLWLARGEMGRAREFYSRAVALDPEIDGALNNLGVTALIERDWSSAQAFFSQALARQPGNIRNLYLLACAQYAAGQTEAARKTVEQALAARPGQTQLAALKSAIEAGEPHNPFQ